jgi:tRNA A-37 threonylcarbamoyl transferase component Bud32
MNLDNIVAVRTAKTVYRDGDLAIKVFNENYSKADVLNEALNQARIEQTGLHIPEIIEVTKTEGKWAIVTRFIEGRTLESLMNDNPDKFDEYIEFFVDLHLDVHRRKAPMLNKLKDKMQRQISMTDLDATTRYDLHTRLESMPNHDKVCHGDFNPSNIIVTEDGTPYILDWSHATQGNASADAARTYLLFWLSGNIDAAKKYLRLFCKKSDTAMQYVQKWIPLVAACQSIKGDPAERSLLLQWVDVIDYE